MLSALELLESKAQNARMHKSPASKWDRIEHSRPWHICVRLALSSKTFNNFWIFSSSLAINLRDDYVSSRLFMWPAYDWTHFSPVNSTFSAQEKRRKRKKSPKIRFSLCQAHCLTSILPSTCRWGKKVTKQSSLCLRLRSRREAELSERNAKAGQ